METLTKPGLQAMDRLQQTVAALARLLDQTMNEMQALDSEVQERVLRAVQEAEESFEQQAAKRLKSSVAEAEENTRILVSEELQARFDRQLTSDRDAARKEWDTERALLNQ